MDCSIPGFPVHYQNLELAQTHVHRVSDAIQQNLLCIIVQSDVYLQVFCLKGSWHSQCSEQVLIFKQQQQQQQHSKPSRFFIYIYKRGFANYHEILKILKILKIMFLV